ncbi:MAG: [FeFe] hydrogenase H-cluster radical SAM maturase HydE [Acidobacteriota bacterium]
MNRDEILAWLHPGASGGAEDLREAADDLRAAVVGDEVHLRGLMEISNHCVRRCAYCGISLHNAYLPRYRMGSKEILEGARRALQFGYGTVVLQAGEDPGLSRRFVAEVIGALRGETGLAVTLSLGERDPGELEAWREAGADRYLLKFETSDPGLYAAVHPPREGGEVHRSQWVRLLKGMGYEVGTGILVGLPGQSLESLAADLELLTALDPDMAATGPYLPHPETPLARSSEPPPVPPPELRNLCLRVLALTRILLPEANIPSTTALSTLDPLRGLELGLRWGANVVMPDLTPERYRRFYAIYPGRRVSGEWDWESHEALLGLLERLKRRPGRGPGSRLRGATVPPLRQNPPPSPPPPA